MSFALIPHLLNPPMTSSLAFNYSFVLSFLPSFLPSFLHSSIHSSPLPFIHLLIPSFPHFMHLLVTRLSISVCKCDHPGMLSEEKQKTQKVIVVFFLESLTLTTNLHFTNFWRMVFYTFVIGHEIHWPWWIWRKLKLRGEDTGSAASSTSSDGKPDEESRLNVNIPSFHNFLAPPPSFPRLGQTTPSFHTLFEPRVF